MKIHLVNYEQKFNNGILSKYANKMKEWLDLLKVENSISDKPRLDVDINHHINYLPYSPNQTKNTLMITHIFEGYKLDKIKDQMKTADVGICFSQETADFLVRNGVSENKLSVILPAHDELPRKKIKVAVVTNVYSDNCKREEMFYELLKYLKENNLLDRFEFRVMGSGWDLKEYDILHYSAFDSIWYKEVLEYCDYMLYFGLDEGAMSILDAKQVGLKCIAPSIGFHLNLLIEYPFITQRELNSTFTYLTNNLVKDWTWENYTKEHIRIWEKLLS